ncbi:unnamed protein product, partial [marine sediment metagenome]
RPEFALGTYYEVTSDVQHGDHVHTYKQHALKGEMIFMEYYVDGQLRSRTEHPGGYGFEYSGVEKEFRDGKLVSITVYKDGKVVSEEKY